VTVLIPTIQTMKYETATILVAFFGLVNAAPVPEAEAKNVFRLPPARMLRAREVPQEHSHNEFLATVRASLDTNNPANIEDPVFGLLGSAAAAAGQGSISDVNCLQSATADQAFTNAKQAGDVNGMTAALVYRALERNTGSVGLASVACTSITPVNPEIAAISQHQDPASPNAATINKGITLELAKQIAAIGGDPQTALKSGTFSPGTIGDPTGAGNTCDVADDTVGCIFTQNLLVEDATPAEISSAVAGVAVATGAVGSATAPASVAATSVAAASAPAVATTDACAPAVTMTMTVTVAGSQAAATSPAANTIVVTPTASSSAAAATSTSTTAVGSNVQTFTGSLGGLPPPVINTGGDRPFSTDNATFVNAAAAIQRSCSVQHNACADAANSGALAGGEEQCETQETACNALITS